MVVVRLHSLPVQVAYYTTVITSHSSTIISFALDALMPFMAAKSYSVFSRTTWLYKYSLHILVWHKAQDYTGHATLASGLHPPW